MYGKNNKNCARARQGTYVMEVGKFSKAYVAQKKVDYELQGNDYGDPEALNYVECTQVQNNDNYVGRLVILFKLRLNNRNSCCLTSSFGTSLHYV